MAEDEISREPNLPLLYSLLKETRSSKPAKKKAQRNIITQLLALKANPDATRLHKRWEHLLVAFVGTENQ